MCKVSPGLLPRWRIGCDDDGYPMPKEAREQDRSNPRDVVAKKDVARAEEKVPRGHYKGEVLAPSRPAQEWTLARCRTC